jgi:two-component system response regulator AlgR
LTDIRMPVMDGIEVARHLSKMESAPKLIFTTAFDEYAVRAFELNAIDYLLKPIRQERLLAALNKARPVKAEQVDAAAAAASARRNHLSIHERGKIVLVPVDDIVFLRAELKYLTVKTVAKEYLLEESLTKLEDEFGELFVRVHRGALVARKAVRGFERVAAAASEDDEGGGMQWVVVLNGSDERLTVSRRQQAVMKEF